MKGFGNLAISIRYYMRTLTRNSWIHCTDCWIV